MISESFLITSREKEKSDKNLRSSTSQKVLSEGDSISEQITSAVASDIHNERSNNSDSNSANSDAETIINLVNPAVPACNVESSSLYSVSNNPGICPAKFNLNEVQFFIENFPTQIKNFNFPRDKNIRKFSLKNDIIRDMNTGTLAKSLKYIIFGFKFIFSLL